MRKKRLILIIAGVVIGLATILFYLWQIGDQQIKVRFIKKYQMEEQQRLGIDCSSMDTELQKFVSSKLKPIIDIGQAREKWTVLVDEKLMSGIEKYRKYSYQCWRLLSVEKTNQAFLKTSAKYRDIYDSLAIIDIIFRYKIGADVTEPSLDVQFARSVDAYNKIMSSLRDIKKSKEIN